MKRSKKNANQRKEAKEFRAQGAEIAQKIRSTADKDVTNLWRQKEIEIMKGEGDGERTKSLQCLRKRSQFFAFYRAMQAYEKLDR